MIDFSAASKRNTLPTASKSLFKAPIAPPTISPMSDADHSGTEGLVEIRKSCEELPNDDRHHTFGFIAHCTDTPSRGHLDT